MWLAVRLDPEGRANMRTTKEIGNGLFDGTGELSRAVHGRAVPAPELYEILGNLEGAGGYLLAELLGRLADGIQKSVAEYEVYEDDVGNPGGRAKLTAMLLREAAAHAKHICLCLEAAHSEIAGQGHRGRKTGPATRSADEPTLF